MEYGIIDRDNNQPVEWGFGSLEEARTRVDEIINKLDGGWKIVNFSTGRTVLTDQGRGW